MVQMIEVIRPVRTEEDYEAALEEIESLLSAEEGTPEYDRLDIISTLVEAYEEEHYPAEEPHPIEAIKYFIESRGLSRTEFCEMIGMNNNRLSEILNLRRPLSLKMIRKIEEVTEIPASILIQEYELAELVPVVI